MRGRLTAVILVLAVLLGAAWVFISSRGGGEAGNGPTPSATLDEAREPGSSELEYPSVELEYPKGPR